MDLRRDHRRRRVERKAASLHELLTGRTARPRRTNVAVRLGLEQLEPRLAMAGVVINEFLAINEIGLRDEDNQRSDWIELKNTDAAPVNIGGWHLADSVDQWQFPNITLAAGEYLVVFASGKNRAVAGEELHTNFQLDGDGEALKLLMPDGTTVVHAYDPFPAQVADVSFGLGATAIISDMLIDEQAPLQVHVPNSASSIDTTWYSVGFDASSWTEGTAAVGFDTDLSSGVDFNNFINFDVGEGIMQGLRNSAYIRVPFTVADPADLLNLQLRMRYEDGFGVYLNGTRIFLSGSNAPGTLVWNSLATASRDRVLASSYATFNISAFRHLLLPGDNVLSIHGLNRSTSSNDFLIDPLLVADREAMIVGYMATPTPGADNVEGTFGVVADTTFSVDRGYYTDPFTVEITTATPGAQIRYTVDGSMPTATTGLIYNAASPPLISTTTTLRAAAFKAAFTPTNVDTQTYIFLDDVIQQDGSGLPPVADWGWQGPDWQMDPDVVNNPLYSGTIKDDLKSIPAVSLVMPWDDWFGDNGQGIYISGKGIERQGSVEFFTADGSQEFQIDAALEIQGGTSTQRWKVDKLSIQMTFKPPYGPSKLDYPLFTNPFFDEGAAVDFNTLILDAQLNEVWHYGGGDNPVGQRSRAKYIQDQVMADLQNLAGGQGPHGRLVNVYINGLYWGMHMLHERPDDSFAESYLGGNKDDYDVIKHNPGTVVAGDATAFDNYQTLLNTVRQDMTVPANYAAVEEILDIDALIDYMIINYYAGNDDWAHHNWYASFNRADPAGKWRFHSWDAERVFKNINYNAIFTGGISGSPEELHQRLIGNGTTILGNAEYRLRFMDHAQKLLNDGGLLTPESVAAVYMARMQEADRALVGESARWGDSHAQVGLGEPAYYTREHWLATQNALLATYFPDRTRVVKNQFIEKGWVLPLFAPIFSQYGGEIPPEGLDLVLSSSPGNPPAATIRYTLDGSDPRDPVSKLPSGSALLYTGPIHLEAATHIKARVFFQDNPGTDTDWSALVDATFLPATPFPVRITELHYHPAPHAGVLDDEDMEFIELKNIGDETINLAGVQITEFATTPYTFGNITLAAGEWIVVAREPSVFQQVYGTDINMAPAGYANANLSNAGERIALLGPQGETLQDFVYDDASPWPTSADGGGPSLHIINPLANLGDPTNWRASLYNGGSPGGADVPIPGDYDLSGVVDEVDLTSWQASFGIPVAPGMGADGNGDGMVDAADYVLWRRAFASGSGAGSSVVIALADAPSADAGSDDTTASSPVVALPPLEFHSPRPAVRTALRAIGATPGVDLLDLLVVDLDAKAVDAAFAASEVHPQPDGNAVEGPLDGLTGVWEDEPWLDLLARQLA